LYKNVALEGKCGETLKMVAKLEIVIKGAEFGWANLSFYDYTVQHSTVLLANPSSVGRSIKVLGDLFGTPFKRYYRDKSVASCVLLHVV
jgi:hypothetical protein